MATTAIALPALIFFRRLRPFLMSRLRTDFALAELDLRPRRRPWAGTVAARPGGHRIQAMESDLSEGGASYQLEVRVPPGRELEPAVEQVARLEGVVRVHAAGRAGR